MWQVAPPGAAERKNYHRKHEHDRIAQLGPAQATGKAKQLFDRVQSKLGVVPNLFRVLGTAPAALEGYLNLNDALAGGGLDAKILEQSPSPLPRAIYAATA